MFVRISFPKYSLCRNSVTASTMSNLKSQLAAIASILQSGVDTLEKLSRVRTGNTKAECLLVIKHFETTQRVIEECFMLYSATHKRPFDAGDRDTETVLNDVAANMRRLVANATRFMQDDQNRSFDFADFKPKIQKLLSDTVMAMRKLAKGLSLTGHREWDAYDAWKPVESRISPRTSSPISWDTPSTSKKSEPTTSQLRDHMENSWKQKKDSDTKDPVWINVLTGIKVTRKPDNAFIREMDTWSSW